MTQADERPRAGHLVGIFMISASALLLEVCLSRLLAVALWYHFAFMIVSGGLLGFGAAAVVVSLWRRLRDASLDMALPMLAAVMALAIPGCFALAQAIPLRPFSISESATQPFYLAATFLLLTIPFFLAGLVVSMLLSKLARSVTLVYALDLAGAGVGSVASLLLLGRVGAPAALVLSAAIAAAAAAAFSWRRGGATRWSGVALTALMVVLAASADDWLPLRVSENKGLGRTDDQGRPLFVPRLTRWSTVGRVDVVDAGRGGTRIFIDGGVAMTRVPRLAGGGVRAWRVPPEGMDAALALAPDHPSVLVVGSGGGYEVASALALGAERVVAVEMNEAIVGLVRGELRGITGDLFYDERVQVVVDEGRSWVRRSDRPVDVIACVHTISNAAWSSGALSLAENYVLTVEAFSDFLEHLTEGGVLWMTRPEAQLPRLVSTAREALARRGVARPADHVIVYRQPAPGRSFLGGLILSRAPLDADDVRDVTERLRAARLQVLLRPGAAPRGLDADAYAAALADDARERGFDRRLGELRPCTDDRPYFNQRVPWTALRLSDVSAVLGRGSTGRMALEDAPVAEVAVAIVLGWAVLFSLGLVIAPLAAWRRRSDRPRVAASDLARLVAYFVALGFGYIVVEICLVQRLGLFVGRPEYALAVVMGAMLVGSGAGSLVATRWDDRPRRAALLALGATILLIIVHAELVPPVTRALLGLPLAWRLLAAAALVAPLGFVMGMPMPLGLRASAPGSPDLVAWAFGLNCASSVVGSSLCVILSSTVGFGGALLAAGGAYLVAALVIGRPR